jgi:2-iminobutanoate/2-iminopropanoate deaminase
MINKSSTKEKNIMSRKAITSKKATSVGPYSHGVDSNGLIFLSGQTPIDPNTGKLAEGDIKKQTQQGFNNLFGVLEAAGLGPDDVLKVNVFLFSGGIIPRRSAAVKNVIKR